jgi:hypothetical protein
MQDPLRLTRVSTELDRVDIGRDLAAMRGENLLLDQIDIEAVVEVTLALRLVRFDARVFRAGCRHDNLLDRTRAPVVG